MPWQRRRQRRSAIAIAAHDLVEAIRSGFRPRGQRSRLCVSARMRLNGAWSGITILNISPRGLMARTEMMPGARSYVEISRGGHVIIGRVVWQDERHFGIRTQDPVSLEMMMDAAAVSSVDRAGDAVADRQGRSGRKEKDPVEAFERSRRRAALGQFVAIVAVGVGLAGAIGLVLHRLFGISIWVVAAHLL